MIGLLKGVVAAGKWLLGSSDGAKTAIDAVKGVGSFIDEQNFTEQEKAQLNEKLIEAYGKAMDKTVDESTGRSKARRELSLLIIRWWLGIMTLSGALRPINPDWADYWWQIATHDNVGYLVLGIGAFFWSAHILRAAPRGKK